MACGHPHLDGGVTSPGVATRWPPDPGAKSSRMVQPRALCLSFPIFQDEAGKIRLPRFQGGGKRRDCHGSFGPKWSRSICFTRSADYSNRRSLLRRQAAPGQYRLLQVGKSVRTPAASFSVAGQFASNRSCNRRSSGCPGNSAHPRGGCGSIWLPISTNSRRKSSASRCARR
jgi:hypothetical protein